MLPIKTMENPYKGLVFVHIYGDLEDQGKYFI